MTIDIEALLQPLPGDDTCGEDISFSDLYDRIREARRADDTSLSQGDWETALKIADWRSAIELASKALSEHSKDLQSAVWLGEALIGRHGYAGASDACLLLTGLIERYWDGLYPRAEGDDLDERASKLSWFSQYAGQALRRSPLSTGTPQLTLADWQTSREIDNLARQNSAAWQQALDEGKPDGETFDRAVQSSGRDFIQETLTDIETAQAAYSHLVQVVDTRFGRQAPSLDEIGEALKRAQQIMDKAAQSAGLRHAGDGAASAQLALSSAGPDAASTHPSIDTVPAAAHHTPALSAALPGLTLPSAATKQQALDHLSEIASYFRRTEPHSPVSSLLERAIAWADMPLDQWLSEVIKDDSLLSSLRERIGAG